jgi:hypothetical protein
MRCEATALCGALLRATSSAKFLEQSLQSVWRLDFQFQYNTIDEIMQSTQTAVPPKSGSHGTLSPLDFRGRANAALDRLAVAVEERNANAETANYSRMHHRHARSHTRK